MRRLTIQTILALLLLHPLTAIAVDSEADQRDALALEVFQMTQSLDELIQLLKADQTRTNEFQKLQSAISYLSFRFRSIEFKQYELRFKKERRDAIESNIARIKSDPDAWDRQDKTFQSNNLASSSTETKPSEIRLKLLTERLEQANSEIISLEIEVQGLLAELATFETYVQDRLGLIE